MRQDYKFKMRQDFKFKLRQNKSNFDFAKLGKCQERRCVKINLT